MDAISPPALLENHKDIRDLPTIPSVLTELMGRMADPQHSANDLAEVILRDPSLAARFLKLANSAWFSFSRPVSDLSQALVYLGEQEVYKIVTTVSVFRGFNEGLPDRSGRREQFWIHSISTAVLSSLLDRVLHLGHTGEAYTAGLLHDVGKIVLDHFFPAEYEQACGLLKHKDLSGIDAERQVLGTDHSEVGAWLASQWHLPDSILAAIRDHHSFDAAGEYAPLVGCVAFANEFSHQETPEQPGSEAVFWSDSRLSWEEMNRIAGREFEPRLLLNAVGRAGDAIRSILDSLN